VLLETSGNGNTTRQTSRSRPAASSAVRFAPDPDEIMGDETWSVDEHDTYAQSDGDHAGDVSILLQEHRDRQTKKKSNWATAFHTQNISVYTDARRDARDLAKTSVEHMLSLSTTLLCESAKSLGQVRA